MQIICKKRLLFQDHEILINQTTNEKVALLKRSHLVTPSVNPQEVPDWIKDDDLFGMNVDDGAITVVRVLSTSKPKTTAKASIPDAGWGAKPGAGLPNGNDLATAK